MNGAAGGPAFEGDGDDPTYEDFPLAGPWQRFFARQLDLVLWALPVGFCAGLYGPHWIQTLNANLLGILLLPFIMAADSALLGVFGQTPGKALVGIRVESFDRQRLSLRTTAMRGLRIWWFGLAAGLGVITFFTLMANYKKLQEARLTSWDEAEETRVYATSTRIVLRATIAAGLWVLILIAGILVPAGLTERQRVRAAAAEQALQSEDAAAGARADAATAAYLAELNKGLPKQIDRVTRLDKVTAVPFHVSYHYTFTDGYRKPLGPKAVQAMLAASPNFGKIIIARACKAKAISPLGRGVTMHFVYADAVSAVRTVTVAPDDCPDDKSELKT